MRSWECSNIPALRTRCLPANDKRVVTIGTEQGAQHLIDDEISLGDFVLSGGEPAAIALIDAVVRLLPGVVGAPATLEEESFERGLLEYPHYTRPAEWQGRGVPEVLLSGHHEKIRTWRLAQAEAITRSRRPDLWARYRAEPNTSEGRRP